jgi:GAF domain-containing protein
VADVPTSRPHETVAPAVDEAYARVLGELTEVVVDTPTMQDVLDQLIDVMQGATAGLTAISVTAHDADGGYRTAATTSPAAQAVDEHEYAEDEGPCIDAIRTGRQQVSEDVLADDRWPRFSQAAADHGFRSVAGVPLHAGDRTVGALNLFAAEPGDLRDALVLAERLARPLGTILANALAFDRTRRVGDELQAELAQLATVEQAVGVLMAGRRCDADTALRVLERTAEATGRSLDEVAHAIVADAGGVVRSDRGGA